MANESSANMAILHRPMGTEVRRKVKVKIIIVRVCLFTRRTAWPAVAVVVLFRLSPNILGLSAIQDSVFLNIFKRQSGHVVVMHPPSDLFWIFQKKNEILSSLLKRFTFFELKNQKISFSLKVKYHVLYIRIVYVFQIQSNSYGKEFILSIDQSINVEIDRNVTCFIRKTKKIVEDYRRMYENVWECMRMYKNVEECTRM